MNSPLTFRKMLKLATRCATIAPIALLLLSTSLGAQAVHPGKVVRVRAPGALVERFEGVFIGRSGDTLLFGNDERGPVRVPLSAITQLEVSGGKSRARGFLRGALWGGGVGGGISLPADPEYEKAEGITHSESIAQGLLGGAFVGGIIGLFIPARVWRSADPRILLTATPTFERGAAAVSDSEPVPTFGAAAGAQKPKRGQAHEGLWIGFGYDYSSNDFECTGCTFTGPSDPWHGGSGIGAFVAAGAALSQRLLLGVEGNGGGVGELDTTALIFQVLVTVRYYPAAFKGFHVNAGYGPAVYLLERPGGSVGANGFALRLGAGYDFTVSKRFALTPYANIARTAVRQGSVEAYGNAGPVTRLDNHLVTQIGLGLHRY